MLGKGEPHGVQLSEHPSVIFQGPTPQQTGGKWPGEEWMAYYRGKWALKMGTGPDSPLLWLWASVAM